MLIAQRNFQMQNSFTAAFKAKMAGLDNPGVHGADCDRVDFLPVNLEKLGYARERRIRTMVRSIGRLKAQRFQPGMALRLDVPLLGDFALEPMCLRAFDG